MNEFKILAYFMHESEETLISQNTNASKKTDSFFIGEATQKQLDVLNDNKIIFQILEEKAQELKTAKSTHVNFDIEMANEEFDTGLLSVNAPILSPISSEENEYPFPKFYKFSTVGPLLEEDKEELQTVGIKINELLSAGSYVVRIQDETQLSKLKNLDFVMSSEFYSSNDSKSYLAKEVAIDGEKLKESKIATYDLLLHRQKDLEKFLNWLKEKNILIAGAQGAKVRIYLLENSGFIDEISAHPMVKFLFDYVAPKLHNDLASKIIGVNTYCLNNAVNGMSYQGEGEIIAIADTGIDVNHPDLKNQLKKTTAWGRKDDVTDPVGHGTHVAGSVAGDGTSSNGKIKGMAPKAKLIFQSLLDGSDRISLPLQLQDLFKEAYLEGARIHNNSWGASTGSRYTLNSIEVDEFVHDNKDMLLVFSAGNDGNAATYINVPEGYVDFLSIGSPASAKNILTVGASRSTRNTAGLSTMTYKDAWPKSFPFPPYYDKEKVSGDPECLAGFSSRGPCDDNRIKPDIVSPGTDIVSTKSSLASLSSFWGIYPGNNDYAIMGGTSMSAPIVSGFAALIREYFVKTQNHIPSAALLKASIINGCKKLTGADALLKHNNLPNWNQGFGMIDLSKTIPSPTNDFFFYFKDNYKEQQSQFVRTGQKMRLKFSIAQPGDWLKICLSYTDIPARALQNNLNIMLDNSVDKWLGNSDAPSILRAPDSINNVEVISIDSMKAGDYTLQVVATNLLKGPQDFALVITSSNKTINIITT